MACCNQHLLVSKVLRGGRSDERLWGIVKAVDVALETVETRATDGRLLA